MKSPAIHILLCMAFCACFIAFLSQARAGSLTLTYEIRVSGGTAFDVAAADSVESPLGGIVQFKIACPQLTPTYAAEVRLVNVTSRTIASTTVTGIPENTPCTVSETGYKIFPLGPGGYRSPSVERYERPFVLANSEPRIETFLALWSIPIQNQIRGNILRGPDIGTLGSISGQVAGMTNDFKLTILNAGGFVVFEEPNDPFSGTRGLFREIDGVFSRTGVLPDGVYSAALSGGYPQNSSGPFICGCFTSFNPSEFSIPPEQRLIDPNLFSQDLRANWISTGETGAANLVSDGVANGIITNFEIRNGQPSGALLFSLRPAAAPAEPGAREIPTLSAWMYFSLWLAVLLAAFQRFSLKARTVTRKVRS